MTNRVGKPFTHFISAFLTDDGDLAEIKKYQAIPGIGEPKEVQKMHITLACLCVDGDEIEEVEQKFKRVGDWFSDITGKGPFLCNFKGLELDDGGTDTIYMKVNLGKEILEIIRGIMEDKKMELTMMNKMVELLQPVLQQIPRQMLQQVR